jgi:Fe2+ transport system protein FeoA
MKGAGLRSTIASAPRRTPLRVVGVAGGRRLVHRLAGLGVVPGARLSVLRRGGVTVVAIGDGRIALGREAAASVTVEEIPV